MESKRLPTKVIDADQLQQLEEEIEQKMGEILKSSNIRTLLEKYGVTGENAIKIQLQCEIELGQSNSNIDNKSGQTTLLAGSRPSNVFRLQCCWDDHGNCIKC